MMVDGNPVILEAESSRGTHFRRYYDLELDVMVMDSGDGKMPVMRDSSRFIFQSEFICGPCFKEAERGYGEG